jgi:hypothetical protein
MVAVRKMSEQNFTPRRKSVNNGFQGKVLGPTGVPMTVKDLPPPSVKRWVIRRKAEVVAGVKGGLISLDEACRRYDLSIDEFRSWQRLFDNHGMRGLRTTKTTKYRGSSVRSG